MAAAYDTYDYPTYWEGRSYEHKSEVIAVTSLLQRIPKIKTIVEIGGGYGRLIPSYAFRAKKIILTDPSAKLLKIARKNLADIKNVSFEQCKIETAYKCLRKKSADLVIMVRVMHHLENPDATFEKVNSILKKNGYFLLEFANKSHVKATVREFFKGNFTFPLDIFPKDLRSKKAKINKVIPFINYHPDVIKYKLERAGFKIIETRSVSNIRSTLLKRYLSLETLLNWERFLQKPLSYLSFGPSIFILAKKKD